MKKLYQLIQKNFIFDKVFDLFQKKSEQKSEPLPMITLSREKGSGGRFVAHLTAKKLGKPWKVYHKEILEEIIKVSNLENALVEKMDEKTISVIDQFIADFFGKKYFNLGNYYKSLVKTLFTVSQRGYAVIIGRGANFLLPHFLKVRVICEMEQRIQWEMEYEHYSRKEAMRIIEKSDEERKEFCKTLFNHDPRKAHHYDLVIRTGPHLSIEDASDLIARAAKRRFKI